MRRIFFWVISMFSIFCLVSCDLNLNNPKLQRAAEAFTIEENGEIVTTDFELPSTFLFEKIIFDIEWKSDSEYVDISIQDNNMYLIDINFEANTEEQREIVLIAEIGTLLTGTEKEFTIIIPKYEEANTEAPVEQLTCEKTTFDNSLEKDGPLTTEFFPSTGNPNLLVIPVNLKRTEATSQNLADIEMAFNGTEEQTGWESVKSYYYESSYGKLNLNIDVLDEWFTPKYSANQYENYDRINDEMSGPEAILLEALEYYDSKIDFSKYDNNSDGYIDSVWLIYNYEVDYDSNDSIYWAFVDWSYSENEFDGKIPYTYGFAGIDFMHPTKEEASSYDPKGLLVDAHTYIHETGHMMGLDDYYDYDEDTGPIGGLYGADMMDYNIGDHCAASKLLLGWVSPTIVSGNGVLTLDLKSFVDTGEFLIITNKDLDSIYNTYYIVEFYTNSGLNKRDKPIDGKIGYGIRITCVRAEKNIVKGEETLNSGSYMTGFKYDNSDESRLFIDLVLAGEVGTYGEFSLDDAVLFKTGDTLKDGKIFFKLTVNSLTEDFANITIQI